MEDAEDFIDGISHLSQVRGLKHAAYASCVWYKCSHLSQVRGLKHIYKMLAEEVIIRTYHRCVD